MRTPPPHRVDAMFRKGGITRLKETSMLPKPFLTGSPRALSCPITSSPESNGPSFGVCVDAFPLSSFLSSGFCTNVLCSVAPVHRASSDVATVTVGQHLVDALLDQRRHLAKLHALQGHEHIGGFGLRCLRAPPGRGYLSASVWFPYAPSPRTKRS